jgi:hypothetical protein
MIARRRGRCHHDARRTNRAGKPLARQSSTGLCSFSHHLCLATGPRVDVCDEPSSPDPAVGPLRRPGPVGTADRRRHAGLARMQESFSPRHIPQPGPSLTIARPSHDAAETSIRGSPPHGDTWSAGTYALDVEDDQRESSVRLAELVAALIDGRIRRVPERSSNPAAWEGSGDAADGGRSTRPRTWSSWAGGELRLRRGLPGHGSPGGRRCHQLPRPLPGLRR